MTDRLILSALQMSTQIVSSKSQTNADTPGFSS